MQYQLHPDVCVNVEICMSGLQRMIPFELSYFKIYCILLLWIYCQTAKPGRCPPFRPIPIPCLIGPRCTQDSQCRASQKCCSAPCPGTCQCPILSSCNLNCPHGRRTDSAGCIVCRCNPPPFCRPGCENGGTCAAGNTCTCRTGFTGRRCENPICSGGCQNGGTCTGVNTCTCPVGFTGTRCQNAGEFF